jgi:competence protein ComEC
VTWHAVIGRLPHAVVLAAVAGLAGANALRVTTPWLAAAACVLASVGGLTEARERLALLGGALALAGLWWGSVRLDALDRSVLRPEVGRAERALAVVTGPARVGRFTVRAPARVERFGRRVLREPVQLNLPHGRAPPQGARLEVLAVVTLPHGPAHGFDERTWLRRHGVHVVLKVDRWRVVGRRGGLAGTADRLRAWLAGSIAPGLAGERRAVLAGVVLGDDQQLSEQLRDRFRASGLYHLLAVSGQNVVLVAVGALVLGWLLGIPRVAGEVLALAAMLAYVLAVGPQPSVIRAGIAGGLTSFAWLAARPTDRWYFLLLGALALLAWNPYLLLDAGFQLSFAAVLAIFTLAPRLLEALEGYPVPNRVAEVVALSAACGLATAPISWLQFHRVSLVAVPANLLAAPAMVPLLGLALATPAVAALSPGGAVLLAQVNGWCAAYLATVARVVGGLPGAQVTSGTSAALLAAGSLLLAAYAWPRWRRSSSVCT